MAERIYTTVDVAKLCKVSLRTVIRWVDEGKLASFRTPGGHRRVRENDLHLFMTHYKIPFSITPENEAKKILVIGDRGRVEGMLQQVLRRSSDVYEITLSEDIFEGAVRIGLLVPDLVIISGNQRIQDVQKLLSAMGHVPETRDARVLVFSSLAGSLKKLDIVSSELHTLVSEPLSIDTLRPHLLGMLNGPSPRTT
jgi:excisionase family DNA binding protein